MLELRQLSVRAGVFSLEGINLTIPRGAYGVLMGKTGSGKTTLMEAVCGLKKVIAGTIQLGQREVTQLRPGERGIGFVPQDTVLFSNMTVRRHLAFGPEIQGWEQDAVASRVSQLSEALGIAHLLDRRPHGLSGGEGKRVALGRALAAKPEVLCLDEPFSALDAMTREDLQFELVRLHQETGKTFIFVTHGISEAIFLSSTIAVMSSFPGRISNVLDVEFGYPRALDMLSTPHAHDLDETIRSIIYGPRT